MYRSADGTLYGGSPRIRGKGPDGPIYDPPADPPEAVEALPARLLRILETAAVTITEALALEEIEAPPPGTFATIAGISSQLQELAKLVPEPIYAAEAGAVITAMGVLPDPLEAVRQEILSEIQGG